MKVQIMSDLHIDYPGARGIPPLARGAALIVVAGDTCQGLVQAVEALRRSFPTAEVAVVGGNHEYYNYCLPDELHAGRIRAKELGVHLLENDVVVIGDLRVIGATMWTDYDLFGTSLRLPAMRAAADAMLDHKRIKWRREPWQRFRPEEARALHMESRAFIDQQLATPHAGPSMVLTHHGATIDAVEPRYQRSLYSAAFASELLPLVDRYQPDWWVSGHTHWPMNYQRGRARMISNPCGYADENPYFDPLFTIETRHD